MWCAYGSVDGTHETESRGVDGPLLTCRAYAMPFSLVAGLSVTRYTCASTRVLVCMAHNIRIRWCCLDRITDEMYGRNAVRRRSLEPMFIHNQRERNDAAPRPNLPTRRIEHHLYDLRNGIVSHFIVCTLVLVRRHGIRRVRMQFCRD